jgi:hypothetical protein
MPRWEDECKMGIRETGIDGANWFRQSQDSSMTKFVNTLMKLWVP